MPLNGWELFKFLFLLSLFNLLFIYILYNFFLYFFFVFDCLLRLCKWTRSARSTPNGMIPACLFQFDIFSLSLTAKRSSRSLLSSFPCKFWFRLTRPPWVERAKREYEYETCIKYSLTRIHAYACEKYNFIAFLLLFYINLNICMYDKRVWILPNFIYLYAKSKWNAQTRVENMCVKKRFDLRWQRLSMIVKWSVLRKLISACEYWKDVEKKRIERIKIIKNK